MIERLDMGSNVNCGEEVLRSLESDCDISDSEYDVFGGIRSTTLDTAVIFDAK